jgi:hypothetical protein
MGLFQVLAEINGGEAEKLLADSLGMTQKGVEATFLDSLLHQMAPDQYKSLALSVAKDLLLNPSEESLKDYQHKTHLYSILTRHRDLDFAKDAQELLIDADGKLDRFALDYLTTVLKADVVPMLAKAHDDPNIKSQWERQSLLSYIMRYVGMHPGVDVFFQENHEPTRRASRQQRGAFARGRRFRQPTQHHLHSARRRQKIILTPRRPRRHRA